MKVMGKDSGGAQTREFFNSAKAPASVTTVGNATWKAADLLTGLIQRTGPTGAYADTTPTAADIVAAMDKPSVGDAFDFIVINGVAFANTVAAGTGVTLAGTTAIAASVVRMYRAYVTNPTVGAEAVALRGIGVMTA